MTNIITKIKNYVEKVTYNYSATPLFDFILDIFNSTISMVTTLLEFFAPNTCDTIHDMGPIDATNNYSAPPPSYEEVQSAKKSSPPSYEEPPPTYDESLKSAIHLPPTYESACDTLPGASLICAEDYYQ